MIAIQNNDICFSTARDGHNPFNTDGQERKTLPVELARTALDFNIVKKCNYDEDGRVVPGQFHLAKDTDGSFIPSASVGYKFTPVQHKEMFEYITEQVMPNVPEMELEMCGTIHGGGVGLIAAKFGDTFAIPGDESPNNLRLFFNNPSNGSGSMTLGFTTVRVVCQNTLLAATRESRADGWMIRHTKSAPEMALNAVKSIRAQAIAALDMKERSKQLARIAVNSEMFERMLEAVYPIENLPEGHALSRLLNLRAEVIRQFEEGETAQTIKATTAWRAFNSFTFPVFNPDPVKLERRKTMDAAEIAYQGMTGSVAVKVRRMFNAVERVAYAA